MPAHAKLSPSGAHRWMKCTAAPDFEAQFPDVSSPFANEGNAAHDLAEMCLRMGIDADKAAKKCKYSIKAGGEDIYVTKEMIDCVQMYVDYCRELPPPEEGPVALPLVETKVDFNTWVPDGYGTVDFLTLHKGTMYVVDLKFGKGVPVDAENNPQLMLYALGALQRMEWEYDIDKVVLVVHQPRLDSISEWEINAEEDLIAWAEKELFPVTSKIKKGETEFAPGDHCKFCRGRDVCEARAKSLFDDRLSDFADMDERKFDGLSAGDNRLQAEQVEYLLSKASEIRDLLVSVEAGAKKMMLDGVEIPGFKLVEGRSLRHWRDENAAEKALSKVRGVRKMDLHAKKLISPAQAEKLLGKGNPLLEIGGDLVIKPRGAPTLVPADDKREPYRDAKTEFDN